MCNSNLNFLLRLGLFLRLWMRLYAQHIFVLPMHVDPQQLCYPLINIVGEGGRRLLLSAK